MLENVWTVTNSFYNLLMQVCIHLYIPLKQSSSYTGWLVTWLAIQLSVEYSVLFSYDDSHFRLRLPTFHSLISKECDSTEFHIFILKFKQNFYQIKWLWFNPFMKLLATSNKVNCTLTPMSSTQSTNTVDMIITSVVLHTGHPQVFACKIQKIAVLIILFPRDETCQFPASFPETTRGICSRRGRGSSHIMDNPGSTTISDCTSQYNTIEVTYVRYRPIITLHTR